jgi:hypothetical protein
LHRFGEVAEWSNAAVLKTVVLRGTGGSNPSFSAFKKLCLAQGPSNSTMTGFFIFGLAP